MRILQKINEVANDYNKTKDPYYKDKWYRLIREWANGKNFSDTDTTVRWDIDKRKS